MLTDTEDEEMKKVIKTRKHRSVSKRHKLNRSSSSKNTPSPNKKRTNSVKLTKEEMKYQRFVNGLRKDIQIYLNKRLRESRFDPSGNQNLQINSTFRAERYNETEKFVTTFTNQRQAPIKSLKSNEKKRLAADVQTILTGPAMKTFYTQFIQSRNEKSNPTVRLRPLEESILWSNEQE